MACSKTLLLIKSVYTTPYFTLSAPQSLLACRRTLYARFFMLIDTVLIIMPQVHSYPFLRLRSCATTADNGCLDFDCAVLSALSITDRLAWNFRLPR